LETGKLTSGVARFLTPRMSNQNGRHWQ